MRFHPFALALVAAACLLLPACGGGGGAGTGSLKVSITDAPFPATEGCVAAALVTIDGVRVRSASDGGWTDLVLAGGVTEMTIDLLQLRNGLSDALAGAEIATGSYDEIRLHIVEAVLQFGSGAPDRTFKVPSGMASGLKIKVDPPILVASGQEVDLTLDVDLARSFHTTGLGGEPTCAELEAGEGGVIFHPVVRVLNNSTVGLLQGMVLDGSAAPAADVEVCAFPAGTAVEADTEPVAATLSSPAGMDGLVEGSYALLLEAGEYDLYVRAQGAETKTLAASAVVVTTGATTTQDLTLP
ncbi:MAG: DUF4382 domain-containing protein [Planctomycetota bacterium]